MPLVVGGWLDVLLMVVVKVVEVERRDVVEVDPSRWGV